MAIVTTNDKHYADIAAAIRTKGGATGGLTPSQMAAGVLAISSGGGKSASMKDPVRFFDYDGKLLHSYTFDECAALTKLPDPPNHSDLSFTGWNCPLEVIQGLTECADIGATYITASGKTEIRVRLTPTTGLKVTFAIYKKSLPATTYYDWGDGETSEVTNQSAGSHTYANYGDYLIQVDSDVEYYLNGTTSSPYNMFGVANCYYPLSIRLGIRCYQMNDYCLRGATNLGEVIIPQRETPITLSNYALSYNNANYIVIPMGTFTRLMSSGVLKGFSLGYYDTGNNIHTFTSCTQLQEAIIPPWVGNLNTDAFRSCTGLTRVELPSNHTALPQYFLFGATAMKKITIPENIASFQTNCIYSNSRLEELRMLNPTPPTLLSATNSLNNASNVLKIIVPQGSLEAYKADSNWSKFADLIYEAE